MLKRINYLGENKVDVWWIDQDILPDQASRFLSLLSSDEQVRADSFYFEKDRRHFIASRFALRKILAQYLLVDSNQLQFAYSKFEKPFLIDEDIQFNVSHAFGKAVIAVAKIPVGIDVEWVNRFAEFDELAQRFFSRREALAFSKVEQSKKQRYFFYIWTKKEAVIKAIGDGLSYPLDKFHVGIHPNEETLKFEESEMDKWPWTLKTLQMPNQDYVAAIAAVGKVNKVYFKTFEFS